MILIADSGSTKTDWAIVDGANTAIHATQGINPIHQDAASIGHILTAELAPALGNRQPTHIFFYGAGCTEAVIPQMSDRLKAFCPAADVFVASDLLGAARALCGHKPGMAAILGTGSNTCLYDGERIVLNIPPLGYILGDEGGGASLGKLFLNALYKEEEWNAVRVLFEEETGLLYPDVIARVYRQPQANRFLASLATFIGKHKNDTPLLASLVRENFRRFFSRNICQYHSEAPLNAVGSIAYHFESELRDVAAQLGYNVGTVLQKPIDGLIAYHAAAFAE